MNSNLHNDLLPIVFAGLGVYLASRSNRVPLKVGTALGLQAFVPLGFWVSSAFCWGHPLQFLGPGIIFLSAPVGFMYAFHVRRHLPGTLATLAFVLGAVFGALVAFGFIGGVIGMAIHYLRWSFHSPARVQSVIDRTARTEFKVEPRQFEGQLLHRLGKEAPPAELYLELYLTQANPTNTGALYRHGTRVLENITRLEGFNRPPGTTGYLQGIVDAPYLTLTPGTRSGFLQDEAYVRLVAELKLIEGELRSIIEEQRRAEEEQTSREVLRSIQRALKAALLALPAEEFDWFGVHAGGVKRRAGAGSETAGSTHLDRSFTLFP